MTLSRNRHGPPCLRHRRSALFSAKLEPSCSEPTVRVDGSRIADLSSQRSDQRRERQALQAISHAEMLLGTSVAIRSHLDLEHRNPTMAARAGRSLASIAHTATQHSWPGLYYYE